MNEDYCDYKLSLALKECGFNEPCDTIYLPPDKYSPKPFFSGSATPIRNSSTSYAIAAPSLYTAQKWLREKKELFIEVSPNFGMRARATLGITSHDFTLFDSRGHIINDMDRSTYPSYECALSAGIASALKLIKEGE